MGNQIYVKLISRKKFSTVLGIYFGSDFSISDRQMQKKYDARKVAIQKHNVLKLESLFLTIYNNTTRRGTQGDLNFFCHFFCGRYNIFQ